MKGKYKAKAANRLAATDNELIVELRAENAALRAEVASLRAAVAVDESRMRAAVVRRADELAAEQIALIRADADERLTQAERRARTVAERLIRSPQFPVSSTDYIVRGLLPLLIPDFNARREFIEAEVTECIADTTSRSVRRRGFRSVTQHGLYKNDSAPKRVADE